jgi:hypothetical protein
MVGSNYCLATKMKRFFLVYSPPPHPPLPLTGVFATSGSGLGTFAAEHQNCNFFLIFPMSFSELEVVKPLNTFIL